METEPRVQPNRLPIPPPPDGWVPPNPNATASQHGTLHYKHGKQNKRISLQFFVDKMVEASRTLDLECQAFLWMLYWYGVRKSELYERVDKDVRVTETDVYVDFHQRKKHSAETPPIKFPRSYPGIDLFVNWYERIVSRPETLKNVWDYSGKVKKITSTKAKFLFPHVQSTKAWYLVKHTLGEQYYPHFFRLNRLTTIGSDPTANYVRIKSFSGIKTMKAMEAYLGTDEKEADTAVEYSGREVASVRMPPKQVATTPLVPNIATNSENKNANNVEPKGQN